MRVYACIYIDDYNSETKSTSFKISTFKKPFETYVYFFISFLFAFCNVRGGEFSNYPRVKKERNFKKRIFFII